MMNIHRMALHITPTIYNMTKNDIYIMSKIETIERMADAIEEIENRIMELQGEGNFDAAMSLYGRRDDMYDEIYDYAESNYMDVYQYIRG